VATPEVLKSEKSAVLKYASPLPIQRHIFISQRFSVKHNELTKLLREAAASEDNKWEIIPTMTDFNKRFAAALKTHRHCYYIALACKTEKKDFTVCFRTVGAHGVCPRGDKAGIGIPTQNHTSEAPCRREGLNPRRKRVTHI
jgi:hypothetical protein